MSSGGALAIFVKTPELSPVKTRLAASIGQEMANQFYELSLAATFAVAKSLEMKTPSLQIYWAVAETEGLDADRWGSFPALLQGAGGLGSRLNSIYQELLKKHHYVCFIGADSPHLHVEELRSGVLQTARNLGKKFVLGETLDGGFYFFGGSIPLPASTWQGVEYSTSQTANQLKSRLSALGEVALLKNNFDVDTIDDLSRISEISESNESLLPEQIELIRWSRFLK